jgi:hypothetical protein
MKSNLNSLNNSRNCQNMSNMRRCDRKCVLSVILRHLNVNIFATKYVIFYRILWRHSWSKMHHYVTQRRLEALAGMHCNSLILLISRHAPSLFDKLSLRSLLNYKERYSKVQIENCKSWRIFVLFVGIVATKLLIWMDVTIFMYIVCGKSDWSCFVKGCRV